MQLSISRLLSLAGGLGELRLSVRLAWRLLGDIRVPLAYKLVAPLTLVYLIWPLDLVPDFLPFLGQFDDLSAIVIASQVFVRLCPPRLVAEHRAEVLGRPRRRPTREESVVIEGQFHVIDDDPRP